MNEGSTARVTTKALTGTTSFGCVVSLLVLVSSVVLAALLHPGFLGGIFVAILVLSVVESIVSKRRAILRRQVLNQIFGSAPAGVPEFSDFRGKGESYVILEFPSKESTHEAVQSGLLTRYLQRMQEVDPSGYFTLETRFPGWDEERWMHQAPPENGIDYPKTLITPGEHLKEGIFFRMTKVIALFTIVGSVFLITLLRDLTVAEKLTIYGIVVAVALALWSYLEFREFVLHRKRTTGQFRWRLAAIAVHPIMLPVYTVALPILGVLLHVWWTRSHS